MCRLVWTLPLSLCVFACPPSISTTDGGIFDVTPDGTNGVVVDTSTGVSISVPKGAVDQETIIQVTIVDTGIPEVPGRKRISYGYRLSPSTLTLNSPITLYLPWEDPLLIQGVDPGTYDMRRQTTSDPYLALPAVATLADLKVVDAQTDALGLFWLTSPNAANVALLTIDPTEVFLKVGDTKQFNAAVTDPTGTPVDAQLFWSTLPPRVGTVTDGNDGGLYTATDPGTATVTVRAGTQTAMATVHVQGSAVGPNSFVHENPFPTGNDLWSGLVLPGSSGTAFVGANGTVLLEDGTGNWSRLYSAPGLTLKAIGGTSVANAVAVGTLGTSGVMIELTGTTPTVTTYTTVDPHFMWFDGTTGMAVGTGNDVIIRQNGKWGLTYNPSFEALLSVVGDGQGAFVVLGDQGSIYKYDPAKMLWNSLYDTQLAVQLTAGTLVSSAGTEAWAVGGNALWHFQAQQWTSINLPADPVFTDAPALGLVDGHIVIGGAENKDGYAEIYDPSMMAANDAGTLSDGGVQPAGWTVLPLRAQQIPRGFFGSGSASTTGYLVGDLGTVYHYAAGGLVEDSRGFYGDVVAVAVAGNDVFAAENECLTPECDITQGSVYTRTDAGVFGKLGVTTQTWAGAAVAMTARSATDVVLSTTSGAFAWNGVQWQQIGGTTSGPSVSIKYCGSTLVGVGAAGIWYTGTSTSLTANTPLTGSDLYSVMCPTDMEMWAAGDTTLLSRDGTASWTPRNSATVEQAAWRAVWSPGQGEAWAFGASDYGVYWDTQNLNVIQDPGNIAPDVLHAMWGSSVDNLYVVGSVSLPYAFGVAIRFDGSQWTLVDSGSQRDVLAIDGSAPLTVWMGTKGGGVLRGIAP